MAYPNADPNAPPPAYVAPATVAAEAQAITPDEQAEVDALYETLKPEATAMARNYVLNRTPAAYQEAMGLKIDADWPVPPVEDAMALQASHSLDLENQLRMAKGKPPLPPI